ncbi:Phosphatidylglycerophosphatase A [uncultured Desulfobacterium sp.]|uniref:Phosphatidylglycerophosphatase A n=1 Tax=uncultured Desulfobacterium sp. TaxID=201089 RepID=A0A445N259_9BACT|nr:Phosphatidylglycerophosphatase A [uncultured Desulfobacterium sp.]
MSNVKSDSLPYSHVFRKAGPFGKAAIILSTWFGIGLFPAASGTVGSVAALPFILFLNMLELWQRVLTIAIFIAISVWSSGLTQKLLERNDPSEVVIDEVSGFSLAMFIAPFSPASLVVCFFLFRIFDIIKPYPIKDLERLKGGMGIVMDDLLAGIFAGTATWGIFRLYNNLFAS